jgi:hypothetical protein
MPMDKMKTREKVEHKKKTPAEKPEKKLSLPIMLMLPVQVWQSLERLLERLPKKPGCSWMSRLRR